MGTTKNFADVIKQELRHNPKLAADVAREEFHAHIAQLIFDARNSLSLTQTELAHRVGTRQSVIARLEDSNYSGHSLTMLKKIADAIGMKLLVGLIPQEPIPSTVVANEDVSLSGLQWDEIADWSPRINIRYSTATAVDTQTQAA